jgi:hypothetical protein
MRANPLTYEVAALRSVLYEPGAALSGGAPLAVSLEVTVLFCILSLTVALVWAGRPTVRHLG